MRPALKRTLAYVHLTGRLPDHIHMKTYLDATRNTEYMGHKYVLKPDVLAVIEAMPICRAAQVLERRGYSPVPHYQQSTSGRGVYYWNSEGGRAAAYERGRWSIDYGQEWGLADTEETLEKYCETDAEKEFARAVMGNGENG